MDPTLADRARAKERGFVPPPVNGDFYRITDLLDLREEIAATGKAIKAFSIPTATGGLTYAVTRRADADAAVAAEAIGTKRKYDTKSDRWYVILDSVETENPIDGLLPLVWPWKEDVNEAENSDQVGRIFNSRRQEVTIGEGGKKKAETR
jgi:hypothetical protein